MEKYSGLLFLLSIVGIIILLSATRRSRRNRRAARAARRSLKQYDTHNTQTTAPVVSSAARRTGGKGVVVPSNISMEGGPVISPEQAMPQNLVRYWSGPDDDYIDMKYRELGTQPHILIAGATGSGKSVFLNNLIYNLISAPGKTGFVFVDLKRVELVDYKNLPQTIAYCDNIKKTAAALYYIRNRIEARYKMLAEKGKKKWDDTDGSQIYIVIDEYAELVTTARRMVEPQLISIAQIGRAAGVHIILCTQRPTRDIITGAVKVNFDCRIALRTATAQDSRNIIDRNGAEQLPRYGEALVLKGADMEHWKVEMMDSSMIQKQVSFWIAQAAQHGRTNYRLFAMFPENFCECAGLF